MLSCLVLLVLIPAAGAITVERGVQFYDTSYVYTKNTNGTFTTLEVTSAEFFLDTIPFCESEDRPGFDNTRRCSQENICADTYSMFLNFIAIIALLSGIAVLVLVIAMFSGVEANPAVFVGFVIAFAISMALLTVAGEVLTNVC